MKNADIAVLVKKAQENKEGFGDLYKAMWGTAYYYCLRMLGNKQDAEDATQTVFVKLMTTDVEFGAEEHLKAWLITVTKNVCKNILKSSWNANRDDYENVEEQPYFLETSHKEIWSEIVSLEDKYKLPIYLYYYEGYKTEEIAKLLKTNHATIRTRLRAAKEKLKHLIDDEGGIENG